MQLKRISNPDLWSPKFNKNHKTNADFTSKCIQNQIEFKKSKFSIHSVCLETSLRSKFNKTIANWKAESLRNPVSKELAPEDASIESYSDFESDRSAVGRLRRRAAPPSDRGAVGCLRHRTPSVSDASGVAFSEIIDFLWNSLEILRNH